jgi:acyl-CoA thioesterase FadM
MAYTIIKGDGRVAAEGSGVIVSYDYEAQGKIALPEIVREAIRGIDGI